MDIYVMRHGQAEMTAQSDRQRQLTARGRGQVQLMAAKLASVITKFDYVLLSPYLRAQQTWDEATGYYQQPTHLETLDELTPHGDAKDVVYFIKQLASDSKVLIVSHLPLVGYIVQELVPSAGAPLFATGGVAHVVTGDENELISLDNPAN
ncbi:phosphohistidine phosphatase SixA [Celerinatantimonas diazotrophica]|uniref:Phosphohistidine phosphatase SixA n=1 Tax=Celerinatantimonas diazotrophica TaxID=412034 RepID=A0A4R1KBT3_9GAMM|nr:phosphohistidine phosphatase SixA [Celerinatantimonas diazotrophica]TCK61470.1 phosphohistidine phosphatase SixA [Celerinatantimonas diazotrophica]CAG9296933.1 Phosphohistidine phosphatase SixA [Celerinatantimonas diazotrophica]